MNYFAEGDFRVLYCLPIANEEKFQKFYCQKDQCDLNPSGIGGNEEPSPSCKMVVQYDLVEILASKNFLTLLEMI